MFFVISKLVWFVLKPVTLLTLLLIGGFVFRRRNFIKRGVLFVAVAALFLGLVPVGPFLVQQLEQRHKLPDRLPEKIDGVVVLGGGLDTELSAEYDQPQFTNWSGRFFTLLQLAKRYPDARIVYSGGTGNLVRQDYKEADIARKMLENLGLDTDRLIFENKSRNTYENMVFTKQAVQPKKGENWLLVTSAFHMPRSVAVIKSNGWNVIPYPAGYIEGRNLTIGNFGDILGNYWKLEIAAKEFVGIIAYRLTGRIK